MATSSSFSLPTDINLAYLQIRLSAIDIRIRYQVRRWEAAGQNPDDAFRGLHISTEEAGSLARRPFGSSWGQTAVLETGDEQAYQQKAARVDLEVEKIRRNAMKAGTVLRLDRLAQVFELSDFEVNSLLICAAPALDLRYERLYGYLQDDVTRRLPGVNLILDLLCSPGADRLLNLASFNDGAPLLKNRLLERVNDDKWGRTSPLNQVLAVDETIVGWLLGRYSPHHELGNYAVLQNPDGDNDDALLAAEAWPELEPYLDRKPLYVFSGVDQASQDAAARLCAGKVGAPLLTVDLPGVLTGNGSAQTAVLVSLRDALLTGAVPYLRGWDACFNSEGDLPSGLLEMLCDFPGLVLVSGQKAWLSGGFDRQRFILDLGFSAPTYGQRFQLWKHTLEQVTAPAVDLPALDSLAGQFILSSGQIRDAVATARDHAIRRNKAIEIDDLFAAARTHSNPHLSGLARKITPRFNRSDIILPQDQLDILGEIILTVRSRSLVLEDWGVGRKLAASAGISTLFAGSPGTGKTMAAEVIAGELGLDLYKIDLSTVVSKYIGETEKNLEKIFTEAQSSNAILFFDEADAIFGKRSEVKDAHDRYANVEISYLLQRMEAYDGVTILATNLRANLDEAFTRRLQFAIDFPFPEEEYRLRIWETLYPMGIPRAGDVDFPLLARRFKLAGGSIRNVIVYAAYMAAAEKQAVSMRHLLHSVRREMQKIGRLVKESDLRI